MMSDTLNRRRNYGSFRIKFSAVSLGGKQDIKCEDREFFIPKTEDAVDEKHMQTDTKNADCTDERIKPCFVTFSVKIYYKEQDKEEDWVMCASLETRPIICTFEATQRGLVTGLLRHTEKVPLILGGNTFLDQGLGTEDCSIRGLVSEGHTSDGAREERCGGSNHVFESYRFKIAIGTAVIRSGRVLYVGHGSTVLRSIELFGKRISLGITGDSCNENEHSRSGVSHAYIFFDINVKHVRWIPCTEHCRLYDLISCKTIFASHKRHMPLQKTANNESEVAPEHKVNQDLSSLDYTQDKGTPKEYYESESNVSTFREEKQAGKVNYFVLKPAAHATQDVPESVYVGSDPKYRVSVLNINNLAGSLNTTQSKQRNSKAIHRAKKQEKASPTVVEEDPVEPQLSDMPSIVAVDYIPPIASKKGQQEVITSTKELGYFGDYFWPVFGGDAQMNPDTSINADQQLEQHLPAGITPNLTTSIGKIGKVSTISANHKRAECILKIGHSNPPSSDPSMLESINMPLDCFLGQLEDYMYKTGYRILMKSIKLKPNNIDLFLFTVTIPDEHEEEMEYTKRALECFEKLSANAISEVEFLFHIASTDESHHTDLAQMKHHLEQLKLDSAMVIKKVEIGSNIGITNTLKSKFSPEAVIPLRKMRSDTALYQDNQLSNAIERSYLESIRCMSERDNIAMDSCLNAIHQILSTNDASDLIQITSPRTSLPIQVDQKWVLLMKQLLGSIKTDSGLYHPNEGVKFVWPGI